jgi:hypothetical protein
VLDTAAGDHGSDAAGADQAAVLVVVVAAIGEQVRWSTFRSSDHSSNRRDGIDQWDQLRDIVAVPAGQRDRERNTAGVGDQVVLGAGLAPVDRARTGVLPPLSARR